MPGRIASMPALDRVLATVRRRHAWVRFVALAQVLLPAVAGSLAVASAAFALFGRPTLPAVVLAPALLASGVAAGAFALLRRPDRRAAAAEADRLLGLDERLSTALAVRAGEAPDPLGFGPALATEAEAAARSASPALLRARLRPALRARFALLVPSAALFLLLTGVAPPSPAPVDDPAAADRLRAARTLRRLAQRAAGLEARALEARQPEAARLAARVRAEAARLGAARAPTVSAVARLRALSRETEDAARTFAGLPPRAPDETDADAARTLDRLAEALRAFENADPSTLAPRIRALVDKIRQAAADPAVLGDPAFAEGVEEAIRALRGLHEALAALPGEAGPDGGAPAGGDINRLTPEQMKRILEALKALREAMSGRDLPPPDRQALEEQLRAYRTLQITDEQIEEMIRAMEELRRLLESGIELSEALARLGAGGGGGGGAGGLPLGGLAGGAGLGFGGSGTGGAGQGRGGRPPVAPDASRTSPDLAPGRVGPDGRVSVVSSTRALPAPDGDPAAYEALRREAAREAEEAIRRGEVPRRAREAVRRFFSDAETR